MQELRCANCERMKAAQKAGPHMVSGMGFGGRRSGAGRKPSTLSGILKSLPAEIAELLTKEFKAKAELIQSEIKLNRLRKAKVAGEIPGSATDGDFGQLNEDGKNAPVSGEGTGKDQGFQNGPSIGVDLLTKRNLGSVSGERA